MRSNRHELRHLDWTSTVIGYRLEHSNALADPPHPLCSRVPITVGRFCGIEQSVPPPATNNFYQRRK